MNIKLAMQIVIGVGSYAVWAFMAWQDPAQRHDFLNFNIALATGTVGLSVRDMLPTAPKPSAPLPLPLDSAPPAGATNGATNP